MYLSSDVHICDTDHQNSMAEINSFDIYSWHKQSVYDSWIIDMNVNRSFNQLHEQNHLVVESHLKLYFWKIWRYLKSKI